MTRRPSRWAALAAVATACICGSALLGGCGGDSDETDGQAPDYGAFYGIAPEGTQSPTDYARMSAGGLGTVRVVLQWSTVEATEKGVYDWSSFDLLLSQLSIAGLEPVATVFGTPGLYSPEVTDAPTNDEETFDAWTDFIGAAAARYGPNGDFWPVFEEANPGETPQPIREWEVWNEPNSSTFWSPTPDPDAYAALVKRSARALDEADNEVQLMTGGMFATPQSDGAIVSYDFIEDLFGHSGIDEAVDLVGVHPYGPDIDAVTSQVEDTRKAIDDSGSDAGLWVTEIGWGSNNLGEVDLSTTPEGQADLLTESFQTLYDSREEWGVDGVIWYTWHDSTEGSVGDCGWCASAGLVDADRDSKPAWLAFTDLSGGTP